MRVLERRVDHDDVAHGQKGRDSADQFRPALRHGGTDITELPYHAGVTTLDSSQAGEPNWIADGLRQVRGEVGLFLVTLRDFSLRPGRFAAEWVAGTRHALN